MTRKFAERVNVVHNKNGDTVFVSFYDGSVSGTVELSPEQAISIGQVDEMAKASRNEKVRAQDGE